MESMTTVTLEQAKDTSRVTVDLPTDDYTALRYMAAGVGRKASMSSLIRLAVRELLERAEAAEDAADLEFATSRVKATNGATITTAELDKRLAQAGVLPAHS